MTMHRGYKAALGLALIVGASTVGIVGAQGMQGMMGGGMHGSGQGGMMHDCPMMGGGSGGMQGMMRGGMHGGGQGGMGMMQGLELDDDQREQLRERRSEHRHQQFGRMAEMMDLREEMHALMHGDRPDPDAVRELHGRMADLHGDMMADRIRLQNDMQDMLTDEQREQMRERMQQQRGGMGGERGDDGYHRRHHGGGS
ncbi:Spy/CpxP family protein refolding chaperone [Aquisalimonas sp.]|uniref:Spy/CpxP family protein refolding chaperone n=1 Tax=unclassified Aquisalimonas TaxID=2644645 RepID=UPI0025BDA96A|nr:Spy/CpxP family protein refolding chaperone [Aquisalimonas sp.]